MAGFAGSLIARSLGERGWRVLVLEAGTGSSDPAADQEEQLRSFYLAGARTPTSSYRTTPSAPSPDVLDLAGGPAGFTASGYLLQDGTHPYSSPYVRVNGGSAMAWAGLTLRMHPDDFDTARYGYGRSWPIGYDDLQQHYCAAEREIGVAGDVDEQREGVGLPFPDDYVFPMHPLPPTYCDTVLASALDGRTVGEPGTAKLTELRVVGTPQGRNGVPNPRYDGGRGFRPTGHRCAGFASCVPICPEQAKYTPIRTQQAWPPNVRLVTHAVVNRLTPDDSGRITRVDYQLYGDDPATGFERRTVAAEVVVLAAHAIENAKLLLMSGFANRSDQVGRNLMDHPVLLTWGLLPDPVGPFRGPGSTAGIEAFRFGPSRRRRAPFRVEFGNWGWSWASGPPDVEVVNLLSGAGRAGGRPLLGTDLRTELRTRLTRQFAFQFEMEQAADPANRVRIDLDHRDALGNPRPVVTYSLSEHVQRGIAAAKAVSDQLFAMLKAQDCTDFRPDISMPGYFEYEGIPLAYRGAGHGAGTHIMGSDPNSSVVNQWQQCWDHPNLYAVGCGSMPSLGTSNPSLTMAALALRTAEHVDLSIKKMHTLEVAVAARPQSQRTAS